MKNFTLVSLLLLVVTFSDSAKLPSTFKKCNKNQKDFKECLTTAIKNAIQQLSTPVKEVGLPSIEPMEVPSLHIGAGKGPVQFDQNYTNLNLYGYTKITSLDADFKDNVLKLDMDFPEIKMVFHYDINGRILVLPIRGSGPGVVLMDKPKFVQTFYLEEYEKKGQKYYKVVKQTLSMEPQRMTFQLDNLFNGDKLLADNVLQVMNDNWKEVYADVQSSYEDAFGQIYMSIFNNLLSKVPISELFDGA